MPGSDTIALELGAAPKPETLESVRALAGVRSVEVTGAKLSLRVDDGARLLPGLLQVIEARGELVRSASVERISLEDVFIHFTGNSLRDEGPQHGAVGAMVSARLGAR